MKKRFGGFRRYYGTAVSLSWGTTELRGEIPQSCSSRQKIRSVVFAESAKSVESFSTFSTFVIDAGAALSLGLIRTQIAFHQYQQALRIYLDSGASDEEAISDSLERLHRLEPSEFTRLDANMTFFFSSLYAVVYYWRKWDFSDEMVDALLKSPVTGMLEGFRHAHTHLDHYNPEAVEIAQDESAMQWSVDLTAAIKASLISWHSETSQKVRYELSRTGW